MPDRIKSLLDQGLVLLMPLVLAVLGGVVRALHDGKKCSWRRMLVSVLTAGFVGLLIFLVLQEVEASGSLTGAACGVGGYAGGDLLNTLARRVCRAAEKFEV
ncbi:MAG: phage holin family protein [Desulfovibrio sp.]|jgi:hypothetical protein